VHRESRQKILGISLGNVDVLAIPCEQGPAGEIWYLRAEVERLRVEIRGGESTIPARNSRTSSGFNRQIRDAAMLQVMCWFPCLASASEGVVKRSQVSTDAVGAEAT
jgi:hypothetical protein